MLPSKQCDGPVHTGARGPLLYVTISVVRPTNGTAAAVEKLTEAGISATSPSSQTVYSASEPARRKLSMPNTRSPSAKDDTALPLPTTTPATSRPAHVRGKDDAFQKVACPAAHLLPRVCLDRDADAKQAIRAEEATQSSNNTLASTQYAGTTHLATQGTHSPTRTRTHTHTHIRKSSSTSTQDEYDQKHVDGH